ncbi:lipid A export ATP-binding/permease protein MsbA [Halorhodospira halochloris]|uniref:Lipid A export ATP-binding/permease protein MsbA n=1 Tax=Halorhodospira halochloris TaxID=1052 RepID=A0A0X8X8S6_HALHR|nr:ABC transporter transmembrane domain-containing protein [Halorhodospira halochloris]BAU57575.1 lipid A export ATP-binding/permease protein MsbA [Halorhodospira halochloris]
MQLKSTTWRLARMVAQYRWRLAAAATAMLIAAGGVLAIGQGLRLLIDQGIAEGDAQMLDRALVATLGMILILAIASASRHYLITWIGERLAADLRSLVYNRLLNLEPDFFERNGAGEIQSRLTADTTVLQNLFGSAISIALRNTLTFVGALTLLFVTSPQLASLVVIGIPLIMLPIWWFGGRVRRLSRDSQSRVADLGSFAGESLHAMTTVQAFGHEREDQRRYAERVEQAFNTAIRRTWQRAWLTGVALLFVFAAVGAVLWQGGHEVLAGRMSPGELSAFVFYAVLAASSIASIAEVAGEILRAAGATDRIFELIDTEPQIQAPAHPVPLARPPRGEVSFAEVTFSYPGRPQLPALQDVSFTVPAGHRVALVGPSGAGKSTVLQLMLRFHDPDKGAVRFDGVDLRHLDPSQLRACTGLVAQEPVLFTGSAAENIRYGKPGASDTEVEQAARDANALDFLRDLPQGLDTELGPNGVQLSGGQRQRIAIARALLRNPALLLLDEATSALDPENEQIVQQALQRLMAGRTTVVIAHRLATVKAAERIIVFNHGRIEAQGTHAELQANNRLYRRFCALQFADQLNEYQQDRSNRVELSDC